MVLRLRVEAPGGWEKAKCRGQVQRLPDQADIYDPFFPEADHDEQDAIDFCNGTIDSVQCPVRDDCLIFALTNNERFGVWGGMTELARKALRKKWPWRGGKVPRPEWHWMTTEEALSLVDPKELLDDGDDDEAEA
jgi:WhiB family redox-sensing transcriptional regulator